MRDVSHSTYCLFSTTIGSIGIAWSKSGIVALQLLEKNEQATREIPPGTTKTYGEIAKKIGSPQAARAVGQALGRNPIGLIIPCHRVVAANGKPGGFNAFGGLYLKECL